MNGRSALTWEERFALGVWYVEHVALATDVRILLRTVAVTLRQEGIGHHGEMTMPRFTGSK